MNILNSLTCQKEGCDGRALINIMGVWLCEEHFKKWNDYNQALKRQQVLDIIE